MNYSSLEDVYGTPFNKRVPITQQKKVEDTEPIAKAEFTSLEEKSKNSIQKNKSLIDSIRDSLPLDTAPATENFRVQENFREKFTTQPVNIATEFDQSDRIARILRLVEQNRTGYERPATQDMVLYIATGIFFLFTFDTFVMLGKSMRGK